MAKPGKRKSTKTTAAAKARPKLPAGLRVGHAQDSVGLTGCTVFLFERGVLSAAEIRGSAPATSQFSALDPIHSSFRTDAIYLTGGSSFGLQSVGGVQRFLEDQGQGFDVGVTFVPRVPCAGIFDLAIGDYTSRPTAQMALDACLAAKNEMPEQGSVGVGMGATIGKFFGVKQGMRGGFGASREVSANGAEVLAFAAVNAYGDIWWPGRAEMLAGTRAAPDDFTLVNSGDLMIRGWHRAGYGADVKIVSPASDQPSDVRKSSQPGPENTTLIVLITTARLDFQSARKVAEACHNGLSDVIYPAHTIYDGDLSMACSIGAIEENIVTLCLLAQRATSTAILNGVQAASSYPGVPSWSELCRHIQ